MKCPGCGDDFLPAYRGQEHCSTRCRKGDATTRKRVDKQRFRDPQLRCRVRDCRDRGAHDHHVLREQHVRNAGGDISDPRNALKLCVHHHGQQTNRRRLIRGSELRPENVEFAVELLGRERAEDYLAREYDMAH